MKKKYLIFAPSYNDDFGGVKVMHRLCADLNSLGHEAYLYQFFETREINIFNYKAALVETLKDLKRYYLRAYKTKPGAHTPIYDGPKLGFDENWVVVYPEFTKGNPLKAKNVVRYLLYTPGGAERSPYYGPGELYFDYNHYSNGFSYPGSTVSKTQLKILGLPLEKYNLEGALPNGHRTGTAYCIRKGRNKPIQHSLMDSVLIDGMNHTEISQIFKRVKTFISYDTHTAYSYFAVLCGADSIVIPDEGVSKELWEPDPVNRYGVAYGFEDLDFARATAPLLKDFIVSKENQEMDLVRLFVSETHAFFTKKC